MISINNLLKTKSSI